MTSDKFGRVRVADIFVGERQRKDLGDLSGLADSFGDLEQLQLVIIMHWTLENGLHKLVSGGRRLGAAIARGDEFIDVRFTDERDPLKLMKMEYAENDQRKDLTWQERCAAITDYHRKRVASDRSWKNKQTAKRLNVSETLVCEYLGISELAEKGYAEIKKQAELSTARTMMDKINKRSKDAESEELDEILSGVILGRPITEKSEIPIIRKDFCEWAPAYTGPRLIFCIAISPGINTDERNQGAPLLYMEATMIAPQIIGVCLMRSAPI